MAVDGRAPPGGERAERFDEWWALARRYVEGCRLYVEECDPAALVDFVVDNNELASPTVVVERL